MKMASTVEKEGAKEEVFSLELPAPSGWKKKVFLSTLYFLLVYFHRYKLLGP